MPQAARYHLVLVLALLGLAWLASSFTTWIFAPPQDRNLALYTELHRAAATGQVTAIETTATALANGATDADLRALAQHLARKMQQAQRVGFNTLEEQSTFSGFVRAFIIGLFNPSESLEGALLLGDALLGTHIPVAQTYDELLISTATAKSYGWWQFWLILVAGVCLYLAFRKTLDPLFKAFLGRVPLVKDFLNQPIKEQVSDPSVIPHP